MAAAEAEQVVTPWEVTGTDEGGINYDKLIDTWGCQRITPALVDKLRQVTGKEPHTLIRRGIFFAHRDLDELLETYAKGEKFYLYTGRGPSSGSLHLGHLIPFLITKYLQDAFDVPLVVQMTDDEKIYAKSLGVDEARRLCHENAKDIIAVGFDVKKTFIFSDLDYLGGQFYRNIVSMGALVNLNQAQSTFGFAGETKLGMVGFPPVQASPSFSTSFPHIKSWHTARDGFQPPPKKASSKDGAASGVRCLIPCASDQDPYFRMTREAAPRMGCHKPALIEASFFPALQGAKGKMSASDETSAIFLTDTPKQIKEKINKYAFSGGQQTVEEHRRLGANLDVDVPYQWLRFFLDDDAELARIGEEYGSGRMLTGEIKAKLVDVLTSLVVSFQRRRAMVTDAMVHAYMAVRDM